MPLCATGNLSNSAPLYMAPILLNCLTTRLLDGSRRWSINMLNLSLGPQSPNSWFIYSAPLCDHTSPLWWAVSSPSYQVPCPKDDHIFDLLGQPTFCLAIAPLFKSVLKACLLDLRSNMGCSTKLFAPHGVMILTQASKKAKHLSSNELGSTGPAYLRRDS